MQRKDFLKSVMGLAVSVPALTSMAAVIPPPETLPEVRNRPFKIKALIDNVRPLILPTVTEEQARESIRQTKKSGLFFYNSSRINQPSIEACWLIDSDNLLAVGDMLEKLREKPGSPKAWTIISVDNHSGLDIGKCQMILARTYHMDLLNDLPKVGDVFYLVS